MEDVIAGSLPSSLQTPHSSRCQQDSDGQHDSHLDSANEISGLDDSSDQKISTKIDELEQRVQDQVGQINENRCNDQEMMISFQDKLTNEVSVVCQRLKDHLIGVYEDNSQVMESRLTELSQVLQNCSQLMAELQAVSQDLATLNTAFCQPED